MSLVVDAIGWTGAALIIIAYFLITKRIVDGKSRLYHLLNLVGGIGLGYNTYYYTAYPSTIVNILWIIIAVYGFLKTIENPRRKD
ncbi:MAG TPA: hypothetical protein EYH45_08005 [Candidatus Caldiarchaeum subterraneum]|uniref:CBU-0592-like domain-containing protein n=1 Tax=Caldiarchaeum subterraneum TaxID=311458 RepID=A0A832ZXQ6_CALS0|nr:hypothetical protein [Aigarchaeota archaeon]HIQ30486.1 hypothetical protein [Candidatus Caldarchaeum subterraneum]